MIQRIPRVVRSSRRPIETDNHHAMWPKPPPKPPPDAKAIFLRWLAAASDGDKIGANNALAELEELAVSPRTKADDSQAGPDRYAASRVEGG
jgi:hypothetical protein